MRNSSKTLIIVPCGKKKIWDRNPSAGPTLARYAYTSNYFRLCVKYAESFSNKWLIFSGKYGLVDPDQKVDIYDKRGKASNDLRSKIREQLEPFISTGYSSIVSLCGKKYSKILRDVVELTEIKLYTPLEGLKIGFRQKQIKECLRCNTSL